MADKVLFIDDSLLDHELIRMAFRRYGRDSMLEFLSTAEAGLDLIKKEGVKAVFINQILPGMDGFEFLREIKKCRIQVPVIMMTVSGDEKLAVKALREGAYDCVTKGIRYFDSLPLILDRALARYELHRERVEMEKVLGESQKQWMAIFDGITDFIFMTDNAGRIVRANRALAMAFGKHPREVIGLKCSELFGIEMLQIEYPEINDGLPCTEERVINDETYLVSLFPIRYDNKLLTVYFMKNITEMRRLKEQLYHSDKLASLGLLVSGVAHEINNPLTGIIAYAEVLRMKVNSARISPSSAPSMDDMERELRKILESADRCKRIVENLLTFSRQRTPSRSIESINDIIDRAIDLRGYWLRTSNIEVVKEYSCSQTIFVDSQQIQQVILNILLNAEQAIANTNKGSGRIRFTTMYDSGNQMVVVKIADDGPGIPGEIISKIFDSFFTTKPVGVGTGLGLSISHGIIAEHGGSIEVESYEGEGATFIIKLPTGIPAVEVEKVCFQS